MKKQVIIDCDPGYDDALALMLAMGSEKLDVLAITTCAGNQTVENTMQNALNVLEFIGGECTVAKGASKPLLRELQVASEVHGETGLDGSGLPLSRIKGSDENAVELIKRLLLQSEEKITLIVTGPLTNIAILLSTYPEVKEKIQEISIMGGACYSGNVTPAAEFNMITDPEAGKIVFESGVKIAMSGLDVTHRALFTKEEFGKIREIGNESSELAYRIFRCYSKFYEENTELEGVPVHDACAVAYAIDEGIFKYKECYVTVETKGEFTTGQTVVDYRDIMKKEKNTKVMFDIDKEAFLNLLMESISKLR